MNMTILIADNSRLIRTQIKSLMNSLNMCYCNHLEAEDGIAALRALEHRTVDLVFLEWNMPNLSGIDFLKHIRHTERFKDIPVIMVTGDSRKDHIVEALNNGVMDYITKPIANEVFINKVLRSVHRVYEKLETYSGHSAHNVRHTHHIHHTHHERAVHWA